MQSIKKDFITSDISASERVLRGIKYKSKPVKKSSLPMQKQASFDLLKRLEHSRTRKDKFKQKVIKEPDQQPVIEYECFPVYPVIFISVPSLKPISGTISGNELVLQSSMNQK